MRRYFLPHTPDVLAILLRQASITVDGLQSFAAWSSSGDAVHERAVRDAEHAADDVRRQLQRELRAAFTLPLDAEDVYTLSERLDVVLNAAKDTVREAEVMAIHPDEHCAAMAASVLRATEHVAAAFAVLARDHDLATQEADAAHTASREVEKHYRRAMSDALAMQDVRELMARRELYRRYARIGDQLVRVTDRIWYAVVKHS